MRIGLGHELTAAIAFFAVLTSITGCRSAPVRSPASDWSLADKKRSFHPFINARLGEDSLATFLSSHTAAVLHGAEVVAATTQVTVKGGDVKGFDVEVEYRPLPDGSPPTSHVGSAAAVTEDGYLVTAAHCVMPAAPLYVMILDKTHAPRVLPARVVWSGWTGETGENPLDFALLHVENVALRPLRWADNDTMVPGARVYLSGQSGPSAGRIVRGKLRSADQAWHVPPNNHLIFHDAPCVEADSGGPLVSADGRLIGVSCSTYQSVDRRMLATAAIRPDLDWLESVITSDRARHHE